ncbi:AT-hook motif nuclear-localized protein 3 [Prosopis cineraria]|uniref:AT-hook motif nuclear-localized protein 3 n=1 Tax=Prosopis cineraria TaxID=364024 RepID=UPI00240EDDDB|nr:AT-hook motif nuclear-localized protein 3 [Prosopis cineraria]
MEEKESFASGFVLKDNDAPDSFHVAPRNENSGQFPGGTEPAAQAPVSAPATVMGTVTSGTNVKKKRGRPRKYGPDGMALALSPMPISSSIPLTGDFSGWKRGRGRSVESMKKSFNKCDLESSGPGNGLAYSVGANFTPHILIVNAGEDVNMKVMSFSQQGSRAICILSANGMISNVTLRQPTSSGGTLTYEGRFEILSLSGSYMPTENGVARSRSGGMSVSLAGPDGRVVGGGLAGLLVAAGPVQVVVGSFLPGHQQEHKNKKQKMEFISTITPPHFSPVSDQELYVSFGGVKPILTPAAFQGDNVTCFNNVQGSRDSSASPFPEKESNASLSNAGIPS